MEVRTKCRVFFFVVFVFFYTQGYSTPLDTIKEQNCSNDFWIQINGNFRCIDTAIHYYPLIEFWNKSERNTFRLKSLNLQLLKEDKWYNEEIQEDRLRIFLIEYAPNYDSIVLFSFFKHTHDSIKLIKKEMSVFYYADWFSNPSNALCPIIEKDKTMVYKETEFFIDPKNVAKLKKQLHRLRKCETFDHFSLPPAFVIEYTFKGDYFLLISSEPKRWCKKYRECKKCPKSSGIQVTEWLKQY